MLSRAARSKRGHRGDMRIAIVGYGKAGRQHATAIRQAGAMVLHSVFDADETVDVLPHRRIGSWPDVLADPDLDAVALCTPPGQRSDMAHAVLDAGKSLLLEKPPAMSVEELDRLAAKSDDVAVMLQHRLRIPETACTAWGGDAIGTLLVSRPRAPEHFTGWRANPLHSSGGVTSHLGIHYLDIACQLLGDIERVRVSDYRECAPGIDIRSAGTIFFASGATLAFTVSADGGTRAEHLVIVGGDARRFEITDGMVRIAVGDRVTEIPPEPTPALRTRVYQEFAAGPDRCRLARARAVVTVLDEVRKAGGR